MGVDRFAREQDLTRSMAIAVLVEQALSESGMAPDELPPPAKAAASGGQDTASGQRAQQWGIRTARKIAAVLEAEKAPGRPMANEFMLDGKRVAIKCAKPATSQCGLTNTMRDRVDCIICASQTVGGTFNLYKVTPRQWGQHAKEGCVSKVVEICGWRNLRVTRQPPNRRLAPPRRSRHEEHYRDFRAFATGQ